jgi:SRSO17 transposase
MRTVKETVVIETRPLAGSLKEFQPIMIHLVNRTELEPVWDHMVRTYHYLGYHQMIGPRIKYLACHGDVPIAALSYNRAALKVGARDRYLGWDEEQRLKLLPHVVNNNRFLILPWVHIRYLASHLLSRTLKLLSKDWPALFGAEPYLVETFVDTDKYRGTCYRAANWRYLGETRGFSKAGRAFVYHGHHKAVYAYLLNKRFSSLIAECPRRYRAPKVRERVVNMQLAKPDWNPTLLDDVGLGADQVPELGDILNDFLDSFRDCYVRSDQRQDGEVFVKGLLSDLDRKSIEPIALRYEKNPRVMQEFMHNALFDDVRMVKIYKNELSSRAGGPDGMLSVDSTEFVKKGKHSVGVARQHCGRLGKTENCQSGVFIGYASERGYGLVSYELFMPEKWFTDEYKPLREKCHVPEHVTFKTKPEMAAEMLNEAIASGLFQAKWIGCDSLFGASKTFLDSLPKECHYFADVHSPTLVWREMPEVTLPKHKGREGRPTTRLKASFPPVPVSQIATDDSIPWERVILGEGSQGPIIADVKVLRVLECRDNLPGKEVWLYIRRYMDGKLKFSLSNAPADIPKAELHRAATLRWPIEQCFEECKSFLGMGHCEARSWNAWHLYILFILIAHLFILEVRQRFKKNRRTGVNAAPSPEADHCCLIR